MDSFQITAARSQQLARDVVAHADYYRVLTGERPTGPLHLGHYFGSLAERVRLQRLGVEIIVVIADYQVITARDTAGDIRENVHEVVLDYLAAGMDPEQSTIFTHSAVPALNQLISPFLSLVTEAELRRNPTVKSESAASGRALSGLLLTYPVHQAADILFCRANLVPVGKDNLPHVELTRSIARRFNDRYSEVFPIPEAILTQTPELPGLDGRKMSKSYRNSIPLRLSADETAETIRKTPTDSQRLISYDPLARPGISALLDTAAVCLGLGVETLAEQLGDSGAGKLKQLAIEAVNDYFAPFRARRRQFELEPEAVTQILSTGNARANAIAEQALDRVRKAMGMSY